MGSRNNMSELNHGFWPPLPLSARSAKPLILLEGIRPSILREIRFRFSGHSFGNSMGRRGEQTEPLRNKIVCAISRYPSPRSSDASIPSTEAPRAGRRDAGQLVRTFYDVYIGITSLDMLYYSEVQNHSSCKPTLRSLPLIEHARTARREANRPPGSAHRRSRTGPFREPAFA